MPHMFLLQFKYMEIKKVLFEKLFENVFVSNKALIIKLKQKNVIFKFNI